MKTKDGPLHFTKMHGAGNDFVVLDQRQYLTSLDARLLHRLTDRQRGVGCDQVLTIERSKHPEAVAAYRIWNADGSTAQQCGNGARCVAAWLKHNAALAPTFLLESPVGMHKIQQIASDRFAVEMGVPHFYPEKIPLLGFTTPQASYGLDVGDDIGTIEFGAVSMGNPHAVIEVDDISQAPVAHLGALLQKHTAFPDSVNVGFIHLIDVNHAQLRVFERGVGETLACGSGACAAAVVMMQRGRLVGPVQLTLPGGNLDITWAGMGQPVTLSGPTTFVFEGELYL